MAPMRMDLPAPVSPVIAVKPGLRGRSSSSMRMKFLMYILVIIVIGYRWNCGKVFGEVGLVSSFSESEALAISWRISISLVCMKRVQEVEVAVGVVFQFLKKNVEGLEVGLALFGIESFSVVEIPKLAKGYTLLPSSSVRCTFGLGRSYG